jgi:ATP-binding cassette subfamily F protein 3
MAIAHAYTDLHDAGEHDAVPRAQALILGLGFKVASWTSPVNSFSGGWRMRLQLARALMCPSDLLLLDEPTNHLDLDALVWLEGLAQRYAGTLIVISHDREFLDAVTASRCTSSQAHALRRQLQQAFEDLRAQQLALQQAAYAKQQDKIAHLQKFIDRFKAKASKAKQAQSRVKALERMEKIAPVLADADFTFEFKEPANLPNPMLAIERRSFGYRALLEDGAHQRPRVIVGGVKPLRAGRPAHRHSGRQRAGQVHAGQDHCPRDGAAGRQRHRRQGPGHRLLSPSRSWTCCAPGHAAGAHDPPGARDWGATRPRASRTCATSWAPSTFTGDMVKQAVGTMSGGEKARLVLAMIVWQRPNLLLLDEPTNHLDLATREALAMALNEFEGTVMLVSHDRALLRACATSSGWWRAAAWRPSTATWTTTSATCSTSQAPARRSSPPRCGAAARC